MAMPGQRTDREYDKFVETTGGDTAVRVVTVDSASEVRQAILAASDLSEAYSYTLVGGKYRLDYINYTAPSVSASTAKLTYTWADFGTTKERVTARVWSIV